ncbi:unnamed protein product [Ascophyllum nodosum]
MHQALRRRRSRQRHLNRKCQVSVRIPSAVIGTLLFLSTALGSSLSSVQVPGSHRSTCHQRGTATVTRSLYAFIDRSKREIVGGISPSSLRQRGGAGGGDSSTGMMGRARDAVGSRSRQPSDAKTNNNGNNSSSGLNSFVAGGLAGSIATTLTCPIEVVKTQLQSSTAARGSKLNPFSVAGNIFRREGPKGFFRGLAPGLVGIIPARSTYFWAYSKSKEFWTNNARLGDRHRDLTEIICGLTAGIVQNTITNPIWMVRTRMQLLADTSTGQVVYKGYGEAIQAILRDEGPRGFYKGISASYWGCSEGCLYFVIYERLKRFLRHRQNEDRERQGLPPSDTLPPAYLFASSAFSKMCATITTYPHEVMRTRLREQARAQNGVYKYTGMWQSMLLVAREEGRRGLYAGMGTHVARVVPNMAIMMMSYELISEWMRRRDDHARRVLLDGESSE